MKYKNIAIIANNTRSAQATLTEIQTAYHFIPLELTSTPRVDLDLIIVLGGDGFMLHCLHTYIHLNVPIYGINCGTVGFLLNPYHPNEIIERINNALVTTTYPLGMTAYLNNGQSKNQLAINEVSLFRKSNQAAKIRIDIDGEVRMPELICDGILLATPTGSSAYNSSVNGAILPIGSNILALTPISPFRPKKWTGALIPNSAIVEFIVLEPELRPVNAVADFIEIQSVKSVKIKEQRNKPMTILFDHNHSLEERILKEQFAY